MVVLFACVHDSSRSQMAEAWAIEMVCSGRVPNKAEVTQFIISALDKEEERE
jgi:protein-tyrosine-phosphatase